MRTLNILIVDDEAFVVDWLISILDAECNLSLNLFSCYGVNEAWRIIGENRIDILVTDIQMPDGSGLDLASNIRRHWADCKVLMLTAYSEFEYAQRAIQSGVDGYILKTEKDSYIINEVRRVIDELNEMLDERQRNLSVQRDLDQYRHHYRSAVLTHWLRGHYSAAEHLEKCMTDLGLNPSLPVSSAAFTRPPAKTASSARCTCGFQACAFWLNPLKMRFLSSAAATFAF